MTPESSCAHLDAIETVKHEKRHECDECVKTGDSWVHLRTCRVFATAADAADWAAGHAFPVSRRRISLVH